MGCDGKSLTITVSINLEVQFAGNSLRTQWIFWKTARFCAITLQEFHRAMETWWEMFGAFPVAMRLKFNGQRSTVNWTLTVTIQKGNMKIQSLFWWLSIVVFQIALEGNDECQAWIDKHLAYPIGCWIGAYHLSGTCSPFGRNIQYLNNEPGFINHRLTWLVILAKKPRNYWGTVLEPLWDTKFSLFNNVQCGCSVFPLINTNQETRTYLLKLSPFT